MVFVERAGTVDVGGPTRRPLGATRRTHRQMSAFLKGYQTAWMPAEHGPSEALGRQASRRLIRLEGGNRGVWELSGYPMVI